MLCDNVGFLSWKNLCTTVPHIPIQTHMFKETRHAHRSVWQCHLPNLLQTHMYINTKTHTQKKNQVSICRHGNQSLFSLEGVAAVCVYVW